MAVTRMIMNRAAPCDMFPWRNCWNAVSETGCRPGGASSIGTDRLPAMKSADRNQPDRKLGTTSRSTIVSSTRQDPAPEVRPASSSSGESWASAPSAIRLETGIVATMSTSVMRNAVP